MKLNPLTDAQKYVILDKGTEPPFQGEYTDQFSEGVYLCRQCDALLFRSQDKFHSGCGWPSFDDEVAGAVRRHLDADGRREEIVCAQCGGHLGHVFKGEQLTPKNTRHCVNSLSLKFVLLDVYRPEGVKLKKAYFAGGCFWGVEHLMQKQVGVFSAVSGYMGGHLENPTYKQVCEKNTGHLETVEVAYNPALIDYKTLAKRFFEIHDPTQSDGQGPDLGPQYGSAVFVENEQERVIIDALIAELKAKGLGVVTAVRESSRFWKAEDYHQDYYDRNGKKPYCHVYQKRF